MTIFLLWGKDGTYLLQSRWKEELLCIFQLVDQPFFLKFVFPGNVEHVIHLWITPHTGRLVYTDYPNTIIPQHYICGTLLWLHYMIMSETAVFLGRMIGCFSAFVNLNFLIHPPTCMRLLLSRNGSSWVIVL